MQNIVNVHNIVNVKYFAQCTNIVVNVHYSTKYFQLPVFLTIGTTYNIVMRRARNIAAHCKHLINKKGTILYIQFIQYGVCCS